MKSRSKVQVMGVVSLIFLSSLLTSCGEKKMTFDEQFKSQVKNSTQGQEWIGTVQPKVNSKGEIEGYTIQADGKNYSLEEGLVSLKSYVNKEVVLKGYLKETDAQTIIVIDVQLRTQDNSTQDGKVDFRSQDLGLHFSYPKEWRVDENKENMSLQIKNTSGEKIALLQTKKQIPGENLDAYLKKTFPGKETNEIDFGGVLGKSLSTDGVSDEKYFVNLFGYIFSIVYEYKGGAEDKNKIERQFSELLTVISFFKPGTLPVMSNENKNEVKSSSITSVPDQLDSVPTDSSSDVESVKTTTPSASTLASQNTNTPAASSIKKDTSPLSSTNTNTIASVSTAKTVNELKATPEEKALVNDVLSYVKSNTAALPTTEGTSAKLLQMEFAGTNYVYVTYQDGTKKKKILYKYARDTNKNLSLKEEGQFEQGEKTTWNKVSGQNTAANTERNVYTIKESGEAQKTSALAKGMTEYTSKDSSIMLQYPRNWYYQSKGISSEGGVEEVTFSSKPHDETTDADKKVVVRVYGTKQFSTAGAESTMIGGKKGYVKTDASGNTIYAVQGKDGKFYTATVPVGQKTGQEMIQILQSVE